MSLLKQAARRRFNAWLWQLRDNMDAHELAWQECRDKPDEHPSWQAYFDAGHVMQRDRRRIYPLLKILGYLLGKKVRVDEEYLLECNIPEMPNLFIIEPQADAPCELCGQVDELRPYGPNGEKICFDCGMKDEETTGRKLDELMSPEKLQRGQHN